MTTATTASTEATMMFDGAKPVTCKTRIEIFAYGATDGSNPGPAGWGFVALLLNVAGDLIDKVERKDASRVVPTNNRAEMAGALNALTFAAAKQASRAWPVCPVTIISDSQIPLRSMTAWMPGWRAKGWRKGGKKEVANRDVWQRLNAVSEVMAVTWHWVEGHSGIRWNEQADALAARAANVACRGETFPAAHHSGKLRNSRACSSGKVDVSKTRSERTRSSLNLGG
jgi:ribonuclease HI